MAAGDRGYDCTCHFLVIAGAEPWPEASAADFLMYKLSVALREELFRCKYLYQIFLFQLKLLVYFYPQKVGNALDHVIICHFLWGGDF